MIVECFVLSVIVGTGALFRTQIGRVVIFNTHSYLEPCLYSLSVPVITGYGLIFTLTFTYEFKVQRLQSLDANDSSTICIIFQQPFNTIIYPTSTTVCHYKL